MLLLMFIHLFFFFHIARKYSLSSLIFLPTKWGKIFLAVVKLEFLLCVRRMDCEESVCLTHLEILCNIDICGYCFWGDNLKVQHFELS